MRVALIAVSHCVDRGDGVHPAVYSDSGNYFRYGVLFSRGLDAAREGPTNRDRLLPFVLGIVFRVTGPSVVAAQLIGTVFAGISIWLAYVLMASLVTERWALVGCALWAFNPAFVGQSCLVLTETPTTVFVLGATILLLRAERMVALRPIFGAGVLLAAAFLTRASAVLLAPAAALWIVTLRGPIKRRAAGAACVVGVMATAWVSSSSVSWALFGVFTPNTHSYLLWDHAAAKIMVQRGEAATLREAKSIREQRVRDSLGADATLLERLERSRLGAFREVWQQPGLQLRNHVQAVVATTLMPDRWSIPALVGRPTHGGIWHSGGSFFGKLKSALAMWGWVGVMHAGVHLALTLILTLGSVAAFVLVRAEPLRGTVRLLALLVVFSVAAGAINVEAVPRYRLPIEPLTAALTALAFDRLRPSGTRNACIAGLESPS